MQDKLRQLQLTQLEILKIIDSVCKKYNIKYSLYSGTLLGAVRHKGFIPWDDDLDIFMRREDYNKFLKVWEKENIQGYILQNKENTPSFTQSFSKIRKDHTVFVQDETEKGKYHTGIFVDIFPADRIPNGKIKRLYFYWTCMKYQLYTREFVPPESNFIVKSVCKILLALRKSEKRIITRKKSLDKLLKYSNDDNLSVVCIETVISMRQICQSDIMDDYVNLEFENLSFMSIKKWDKLLKIKFGDYMQFPPVDERTWKHHPIILDFEHNYEELDELK